MSDLQIQMARRWLRLYARPLRHPNRRRTSYQLKHVAESWAGRYISHAAFLEAARRERIRLTPVRPWMTVAYLSASTYAAWPHRKRAA